MGLLWSNPSGTTYPRRPATEVSRCQGDPHAKVGDDGVSAARGWILGTKEEVLRSVKAPHITFKNPRRKKRRGDMLEIYFTPDNTELGKRILFSVSHAG